MQTFLPFESFARSASVLDGPRLGKQRVETLQVLRALELPDYGWGSHPAVRMWRGYTPALAVYGLACVREWTRRGHADSTRALIAEFAPGASSQAQLARERLLPPWLGDVRLHVSHQAALVRKAPELYREAFAEVDPTLEYHWPGGPDASSRQLQGTPLWVLRAPDPAAQQQWLEQGLVGLGNAAGIEQDITGLGPGELKSLLRQCDPPRSVGKALRQLRTFVDEVELGHPVAVIDPHDPQRLLVGVVVGGYAFRAAATTNAGALPCHRRAVRWAGRLQRCDALPPASLQDPRQLFRVGADPEALAAAQHGSFNAQALNGSCDTSVGG